LFDHLRARHLSGSRAACAAHTPVGKGCAQARVMAHPRRGRGGARRALLAAAAACGARACAAFDTPLGGSADEVTQFTSLGAGTLQLQPLLTELDPDVRAPCGAGALLRFRTPPTQHPSGARAARPAARRGGAPAGRARRAAPRGARHAAGVRRISSARTARDGARHPNHISHTHTPAHTHSLAESRRAAPAQAVCMDGTGAGYYFQPGTDPNSFVIYMEVCAYALAATHAPLSSHTAPPPRNPRTHACARATAP
jgi:hypothetical protein